MISAIFLDISRLILRGHHPVPTGIDRVELAYAEHLIAHFPDRTRFIAAPVPGMWNEISTAQAHRLVARIGAHWRSGTTARGRNEHLRLIAGAWIASVLPRRRRIDHTDGRSLYLLVSHHHLDQPRLLRRILARTGAAFVPLIHDLIPIDYAEYVRANEPARHRRRIETVAGLADAILVNSRATALSLAPWLAAAQREPPVVVAPLGVEPLVAEGHAPFVPAEHPYFVCVGTIEPRKNHHLLLQIWRRLSERFGPSAPHLHIIGKRGWENHAVFGLLDRCRALGGVVIEHNHATDADLAARLMGARALLMPSFAEGYGLPIAEALSLGVPALCSDLPAFREVGGDAAIYLDPLDGAGWLDAILDFAQQNSQTRADAIDRIRVWRHPTWADHMATALELLEQVSAEAPTRRRSPLDGTEPVIAL